LRRAWGRSVCVAAALLAVPALAAGPTPQTSATPATPDASAEPPADSADGGTPAPEEPTSAKCIDANETAQRLLRAGSLAQAREQVKLCVVESCPEPIRADCNDLAKAIEAAMPTVRFDARDENGKPVTEVKVIMNGQPLLERLDGNPVPIEPGKHRFVFESPGLPRTTKTLVLKAGEQRGERVDMIDKTGPLLRTTGLVVAGIGVISIGYGTFRAFQSKSTYDDALKHCPNGPNSCTQAGVDGGEEAHDQAAAATTTIAIGSVLVAGGLAVYLFVPEQGFRIVPGVRQGGLTLEAGKTW
jgi:hypothetical protein